MQAPSSLARAAGRRRRGLAACRLQRWWAQQHSHYKPGELAQEVQAVRERRMAVWQGEHRGRRQQRLWCGAEQSLVSEAAEVLQWHGPGSERSPRPSKGDHARLVTGSTCDEGGLQEGDHHNASSLPPKKPSVGHIVSVASQSRSGARWVRGRLVASAEGRCEVATPYGPLHDLPVQAVQAAPPAVHAWSSPWDVEACDDAVSLGRCRRVVRGVRAPGRALGWAVARPCAVWSPAFRARLRVDKIGAAGLQLGVARPGAVPLGVHGAQGEPSAGLWLAGSRRCRVEEDVPTQGPEGEMLRVLKVQL